MNILETIEYVVNNASYVRINKELLLEYCTKIQTMKKVHWLDMAPCKITCKDINERLNIIFLIDSISFCYWKEPKWRFHNNNFYDGTWGLICAISNALKENKPLFDFEYVEQMKYPEFSSIFYSATTLSMLKERYKIIQSSAKIINNKYNGLVGNIIKKSDGNAITLLTDIITNFDSFDDYSFYKGAKILFYKRAQLLVSDLSIEVKGKPYEIKEGLNKLTACADYKLPYVLNNNGILEYNSTLQNKIQNKIEILENSIEEIEIRASTIWAIELMKNELNRLGTKLSSIEINDLLWLNSQENTNYSKNYHRTKTTKY
jgi:hypothetical protein